MTHAIGQFAIWRPAEWRRPISTAASRWMARVTSSRSPGAPAASWIPTRRGGYAGLATESRSGPATPPNAMTCRVTPTGLPRAPGRVPSWYSRAITELRPAMTSSRRALLLILLSYLVWGTWEGLHTFVNPWGDLNGEFTDHFSHMNCARLFPRVGIDLWRRPLNQMLRPLTVEEIRRLPFDTQAGASFSGGFYAVPGWPVDKPMMAG